MRILFTDIVPDATITATEENANYPASNIAHVFLRKRYQCLVAADTLTLSLPSDRSLSMFAWGFHNMTGFEFRLYDVSDSLLHTETVSSPDAYGAVYFTQVDLVRKIEIDIAGPANCYLGKVSGGVHYQAPGFQMTEPMTDKSVVSESGGGQTLSSKITPFLGYSITFHSRQRANWLAFRELYRGVGIGETIWVDAYPDDHTRAEPLYCAFIDPPPMPTEETEDSFSWTANFREAR